MTETEGRRVLVVDDDERIRALVERALREAGFETRTAGDGRDALAIAWERQVDLVVLDIGLPTVDGLDVLHRLRADSQIPVILLTGRAGETDRVVGLELGADDYVVKPFSPRELVARVRTILRRSRGGDHFKIVYGQLVIDLDAREVSLHGAPVELAAKELDLLVCLASAPRIVLSRRKLLQSVWHDTSGWTSESTVTEHVYRLRNKIEEDPRKPRWIRTVRGAGYRFEPREAQR
ncbi:response regulator transcription factor [Phytohabitans rumicis]|uniref:DNA-binding response regulator n=1 Tax=Phytohabitans rumicis TaxID=1076125 RepID=A0A6V8LM13_9ACTN|nr:response regulator transcription factor [Phytohabitans rumicis]GFJ95137.1 DNA-binding response regulator [Phytohabitans rumicis]